jgi:hypothetical protein
VRFTVQPYILDYTLWGVTRTNDGPGEGYRTRQDAQKRAKQLNDFARRSGYVVWGGQCYIRVRKPR